MRLLGQGRQSVYNLNALFGLKLFSDESGAGPLKELKPIQITKRYVKANFC
jgi:hypothetical protein